MRSPIAYPSLSPRLLREFFIRNLEKCVLDSLSSQSVPKQALRPFGALRQVLGQSKPDLFQRSDRRVNSTKVRLRETDRERVKTRRSKAQSQNYLDK